VSEERFDIYFAGELLPDQPVDAVKQWLGAQFKLQGQALERLFSGQPVRIKQSVDLDTAGRYRAAFRQAGALLEIRPAVGAQDQPAAPSAQPTASEAAASAAQATAHPGEEPELLPPNTGSLEDCAMPVEAAPLPDIDAMQLDSPEHPLDDRPPAPPAQIATEHLSAAPANSGDLSDCVQEKPAQPIPDISQLHLAED
jgi:hypothetical protein